MSFGRAAQRSALPRRIDGAAPCPCGSGGAFGVCCGPLLRAEPAVTAEQLMRSRYTAFFLGDAAHLARSWHPRTRPDHIEVEQDLRWTGLQIVGADEGGVDDEKGQVEFIASWVQGPGSTEKRGEVHERSRFVRHAGRWCYLDGDAG